MFFKEIKFIENLFVFEGYDLVGIVEISIWLF